MKKYILALAAVLAIAGFGLTKGADLADPPPGGTRIGEPTAETL